MYAKVVNGQVTQAHLPTSGVLNGRTVSNYNLLPESVLLAEGWLPLVENKPEYDADTQELQLMGYTVETDRVTANYEAVAKLPTIEDRLEALKALAEGVSIDFMGYLDWYYATHPDEA
jgi:hypothetical protein